MSTTPAPFPAYTGTEPCVGSWGLFYADADNGDHVDARHRVNWAVEMCATCPMVNPCGQWGIERETHGIWGGLSEKARHQIRRVQGIPLHSLEAEWNLDSEINRARRRFTDHTLEAS